MTANPGRLALCEREDCDASFRILRGQDARLTLLRNGWTYDPEYCPAHRPRRAYTVQIIRDDNLMYMPPHPYVVGRAQPMEKLLDLLRSESYDPNTTVEILSEEDLFD